MTKIQRNDPCHCGSGKKFKHCHGAHGHQDNEVPQLPKLHQVIDFINSGRLKDADISLQQLLHAQPNDPETLYYAGIVAFQLGRVEQSIDLLQTAVSQNNRYADAFHALGMICLEARRMEDAATAYEHLLEMEPTSIEVLNNLGNIQIELGALERGAELMERALNLDPTQSEVKNNLGAAYQRLGRLEQAQGYLSAAVSDNPNSFERRYNLAQNLRSLGKYGEALAEYRASLDINDTSLDAWQGLVQCYSAISEFQIDARTRSDILSCLDKDKIEITGFTPLIMGLIRNELDLKNLAELDSDLIEDVQKIKGAIQILSDPIISGFLGRIVFLNSEIEHILTALRKIFLTFAIAKTLPDLFDAGGEELLYALSRCCFLSEYIFWASNEEMQQLEYLETRSDTTIDPLAMAVIAAYKPLNQTSFGDEIAVIKPGKYSAAFTALIRQQIREPNIERELAKDITGLSVIKDDISQKVKAQYEINPYPRWQTLSYVENVSFASYLLKSYPHLGTKDIQWPSSPRVLVAGCGTGRAPISLATSISCESILAFDLSQISLAYGIRKSKELNISNIQFAQADILELGGIENKFDIIECSGVLHHMKDPMAGWRNLVNHLKPGGFMRIALYSERARRYMVQAQKFAQERGYSATNSDIRKFRQEVFALEDSDQIKNVTQYGDFYSLSNCRDMFFHVQEHRFTIPKIADALHQFGLTFVGFEFVNQDAIRSYKSNMPQDATATSLEHWHAYEQDHPDTFNGMYSFWVLYSGS